MAHMVFCVRYKKEMKATANAGTDSLLPLTSNPNCTQSIQYNVLRSLMDGTYGFLRTVQKGDGGNRQRRHRFPAPPDLEPKLHPIHPIQCTQELDGWHIWFFAYGTKRRWRQPPTPAQIPCSP